MNKTLLILHLLSSVLFAVSEAHADEVADSVATDLTEIVVEGRSQRTIKNGVEYTPDKKTKKIATDATSLLEYMQIPQLSVNPINKTVTTRSGQGIAFFIDYMPATEQDLQGMRTEDVLRVEVLDYPSDPRFNSSDHVINYIMRKYEWGGYTKLDITGTTLSADMLSGTLYSKFAYKGWTFDAKASGYICHDDNSAAFSREAMRDIYIGDRHFDEIVRTATAPGDQARKNNNQFASFRATWMNSKVRLIHSISYMRQGEPLCSSSSEVAFSDNALPASSSVTNNSGQTISPSISGKYLFTFDPSNFLSINWDYRYAHTRRHSLYRLGSLDPIITDNSETLNNPALMVQYSHKFAHDNTLRAMVYTLNSLYNTDYSGTSYNGHQKLLSSETLMFLEYMQSWKSGLNLYARLGSSYVAGRVNGKTTLNSWNPRLGFQLQYRFNQSHAADISAWWGNSSPEPSTTNSAIVQDHELMWVMGNPDLKNILFVSVFANYSYIPNDRFALYANLAYDGNPDKIVCDYITLPGYDGLVRRYVNSGTIHNYTARLTGSLRLLDNSLSLQGSVCATRTVLTGIDATSFNYLSCNVMANYMIGNFAFYLFYTSPGKSSDLSTLGKIISRKSTYGAGISYAVGNFNASMRFNGWFDSNRSYTTYDTPRYSSYSWHEVADYSRSLSLSLSYTLPYGKHVDRNNELQNSGSVSSAILH